MTAIIPKPPSHHSIERLSGHRDRLAGDMRQEVVPQKKPSELIQEALRRLQPGEDLFVDSNGRLHSEKEPFLHGEAQPLASFRKTPYSDDIIVNEGLPPRNLTYCSSGSAPTQDVSVVKSTSAPLTIPVRYSTILRSGDELFLAGGDCKITIPDSIMETPRTPGDKLAKLIALASAGQSIELGRIAVPSCPGAVSRVHCTALIIKNDLSVDGAREIVVKVFPGMPGKHPISIGRDNGSIEEIQGERRVAPGTQIILGPVVGTVTLPYEEGSIKACSEEISLSIRTGSSDRAREALRSYVGPEAGQFSVNVRVKDRVEAACDEGHLIKVNVLQNQIVAGLRLIKSGQAKEAIKLFSEPTALEMLGYRFDLNNCIGLERLTPEAVRENIIEVGSRSWFKMNEKVVYPSAGRLKPGLEPQNEEEVKLLATWRKEMALIWAEEYTHALQDALGSKMVSRKAELLPYRDHEADVALFFHEYGVPLICNFVKDRYPQRQEALEIAAGFQTSETQQLFSEALISLPIGQRLLVGRNPDSGAQHYPEAATFSLPRPEATQLTSPGLLTGRQAHALMAHIEAVIVKHPDGSYNVAPFRPNESAVFAPNSAGYYNRLTSRERIEPGTPIYIGRAFRLVL